MQVAELFVNLGIKGAEATGKALGSVKSGLEGVANMSFEAKAAIVGALYAFERLMSTSSKTGTGLLSFETTTGRSAQQLQQWQFAARQMVGDAEDVEQSVRGVQKAMLDVLNHKGAPEGFGSVTSRVKLDMSQARDPFYILGKLQEYASKVPPDIAAKMIKSFGVGEGTLTTLMKQGFNPSVLKKAPTYSESEITKLNKVDVAFANLKNQVSMGFGKLFSQHGLEMVNNISMITAQVLKLVNALITLGEKMHIFEAMDTLLKVLTETAKGTTGIVDDVTNLAKAAGGDKGAFEKWWEKRKTVFKDNMQHLQKGDLFEHSWGIPTMKVVPPGAARTSDHKTNLTVNNYGVKDAKDAAQLFKRDVQQAVRQSPALVGGH